MKIIECAFVMASSLVLGASCGGDDDGGGGGGSTLIGAEGGTVSAGEAKVVIPAGALDDEVDISISTVSGLSATLPTGVTLSGDAYAFEPHGIEFNVPVTITIPFSETDTVVVRLDDDEDSTWESLEVSSAAGGSTSLSVSTFSIFSAGIGEGGAADCETFCDDREALGCSAEQPHATCVMECEDPPIKEGDPCYPEFEAFGLCVTADPVATNYECQEDNTSGLKDGVCADELSALLSCGSSQ